MFASGIMFHSVAMWLKLVSFHHVMHDVRGLVRRVERSKKKDKKIPYHKREHTVFGVNKDVYTYALEYPNSLSRSNFIRFMFAPTCCY